MARKGKKLVRENGNYTVTFLVSFSGGTVQCLDGNYQQKSYIQCAVVDSYLLCYFRALYFIECTVPRHCKYYCLCWCYYGIVPVCDNADEPE